MWCSDACRQRGYRERRKAGRQLEPPHASPESTPASSPHTIEECIVAVLEAPHAVGSVLDAVRRALRDGALDRSAYAEVQVALVALGEEMNSDRR